MGKGDSDHGSEVEEPPRDQVGLGGTRWEPRLHAPGTCSIIPLTSLIKHKSKDK